MRALRPVVAGQPTGLFSYDASGNLTHRSYADESHRFVYDGNDELREAVQDAPSVASEIYYYDHTGQRVLAYSTAAGAQPARLRFWLARTELEYAVTSSPGEQRRSQVFVGLGEITVARIVRQNTTTFSVHLLYSGVLGNLLTVLRTDIGTAATPIAGYGYGPFGEQLYEQGASANDFHRLFNGKEHDELTGLSYYGYRYYDLLSLQWTQADPLYRFAPELVYLP